MEINGLAGTVISEDKLILTQIINASQTIAAVFFLCEHVHSTAMSLRGCKRLTKLSQMLENLVGFDTENWLVHGCFGAVSNIKHIFSLHVTI